MRRYETDAGVFEVPDFPVIQTKKGPIKLPVMYPILVPRHLVVANNYNPNRVPDNNMELLLESIVSNGFTFAVVTVYDEDRRCFVIVDGFHRYTIFGEKWLDADMIPIIVLEQTMAERMAATVQFNRARGVHQVELMAELVRALVEQGLTDEEISTRLGMELEEVFRLKQITGIAELFKNQIYSKAWEMMEVDEEELNRV